MDRVKYLNHKGREILVQDLTDSKNIDENIAVFDRTQGIIAGRPEKSVLLLTVLVNTHYSPQAVDRLKRFSVEVTPHIKASAAVGITGIKKVVYQTLSALIGRKIHLFDSIDRALDWLAEQE
ncbi:MAG: hypothetical protein A2509_08295 [Candidatus Edwardsbacteria bacterium RIFOXYD12_FULL_50_11]|uniref:STAS/SEC14 domain-containing protein n=1 Tax=Candidatus Edwardsbacteria bacterium GWF2_54_11 TaxID=1817851 RepID=A0A1F5RH36_9BACT|nr:MAG: hypothetical protein A2502_01660 [Candidatus Edwardsbacteria bacterium RifOxyC12_full_54_24]OGF08974.1 MAG: hypothetical protein A2273_10115 [Candidatus Edwardsbacteria bacterium RifOxyA12_full_54_48]OGF12497.1 MAG: hypothetical protein A3K15_01465 [Candidatus Edwardsbacteria bacterium GWE2_54_12]OGF13644.1 MAG: hypothetical protein A2024_10920 [Candidatus Edwardsbacteria bacterium GWF2_54_11]OGF17398.1 MAG: hypothetical protein A2509_08295 [Candidatus Edwardsbacteria bacterium RIFOXYD1